LAGHAASVGVTIMALDEIAGGDTWLSLPPTARQTWSAVAVVAVALIAFGAVAPFAGRPLPELNAFFPSLDAIVSVTDSITSVLLFAQFSVSRSRSLLVLASGYLFTALIVIPHALTFSGAFSPTGLLGAGIQTGSWLFIFWHVGFGAALLGYAALRKGKRAESVSQASTMPAIGWSVASVFGLVCGLTWLSTAGVTLLPPVILDGTRLSPFVIYPISFAILISVAALAILSVRRRSVLDQWLMVVTLVSIAELAFSGLFPSVRFSAGFYAGRAFSLVTSSVVLIVLLAETTRLYVRLARSNTMLQRERNNKLMNLEAMAASIAHEMNQPLGAIALSGEATLLFLQRTPPDLGEAEATVSSMVADSHHAGQILDNIRTLFGTAELKKEQVDVNSLTLEVLRTLKPEFASRGIETSVELVAKLPPVMAHRGQLQEVVINLVRNAMEAMETVDGQHTLRVKTELNGNDTIVVAVEDTGPGLDSEKAEAIFDAFVTTKPDGMGLGLAICRMIVERHEGRLSASSVNPRGAVFRVTLPRANLLH
jgi:signal transduction histidine kinase